MRPFLAYSPFEQCFSVNSTCHAIQTPIGSTYPTTETTSRLRRRGSDFTHASEQSWPEIPMKSILSACLRKAHIRSRCGLAWEERRRIQVPNVGYNTCCLSALSAMIT